VANSDDDSLLSEQEKRERNAQNNANTLRNAAEVAVASGEAHAVAIGEAVKVADKATGGKSTELLGKGLERANRHNPGGKMIQGASNKLAESGLGDKIGKGAAMYLREENRIVEMDAVRVGEIVNTVGAGDALFSAFVHYYAKGLHPVAALQRAQLFASAKIGVSGASQGFVTEKQIETWCLDRKW